MIRVALVAAVSDPQQAASEKYSLPSQLADGRALAEARDWTVVAEVVIPGQSRSYDWLHEIVRDLPEYARLVDLIAAEAVDVIVARDYDRLWRTDALRAQLQVLCEQHRVQIYSLNQPTEVQAPDELREISEATQLTQMLFGWSAQTENQLRDRRRRMGMRGRIKRGLSMHWLRCPYGYEYVDKHTPLAVNAAEARWVRWLYEQRARGSGYVKLAAQLTEKGVPTSLGADKWGPSAVRTILHNRVYVGEVVYRESQRVGPRRGRNPGVRRIVAEHVGKGAHEPLVSRELWEQVQRINRENRRDYVRSTGKVHVLRGVLVCGYCGKGMVHVYEPATGRYYMRCITYNRTGGRECQVNSAPVRRVLAFVVDALEAALADRDGFMEAYEAEQAASIAVDRQEELGAELSDLRARQERLLGALEAGIFDLDTVTARQAGLASRERMVRSELAVLEAADARVEAVNAALKRYGAYIGRLGSLPPEELRAVVLNLLRSVTIMKGRPPRIEWL